MKRILLSWMKNNARLLQVCGVILLLLLATLCASVARADEGESEADCGAVMCSQALTGGEPAPWAGILFSQELALELTTTVDNIENILKIERKRNRRILQVELDGERRLREIDAEAHAAAEAALRDEIDRQSAWWRSPEFVASVAVVIVVALEILSVYLFATLSQSMQQVTP